MDPRPHDFRLSIDGIEGAEIIGGDAATSSTAARSGGHAA
jgi:hypothetical protein